MLGDFKNISGVIRQTFLFEKLCNNFSIYDNGNVRPVFNRLTLGLIELVL